MAPSFGYSSSCLPTMKGGADDKSKGTSNGCAICLENMEEDLAALVCGHVFHRTCVKRALVSRPACPVCRRKASPQSAIRLYLSMEAREGGSLNRTHYHSNRDGNSEADHDSSRNGLTRVGSRLPERMREMRNELDRVNEIQRMTSSHSFRLENELVRLRQQQEQTKRQMQHIQHELDRTSAKLTRLQRIATASYSQCREVKQASVEFERKIHTTADRLLEKIRKRPHMCCPSCTNQWAEMKRIALEIRTTVGANLCCQRHSRPVAMRDVSVRLPQHHRHNLSCYDV